MKKIINKPENVVSEMLEGIAITNPDVVYHPGLEVISRKNKSSKVGLVSGGGSGHEPAHAGYVGKGMLDAAVAGNVFASPSPDRIMKGIEEASGGKGVLLIVKNYSGDIMNFEMAKDMAEMDGTEVEMVVVKDDVATEDNENSAGRRGIAGTVLIHKIAGAKAEMGASLQEIAQTAREAIKDLRTMGMSLSSCTLPAVGVPGFTLGEDEIEIGMGIHGEPGIERTTIKSAKELAAVLLGKIFADRSYEGEEVAVLINGLGGTPYMELSILAKEVDELLRKSNVKPYRYFVGEYMTALEMAGASVSLLALNDERKELLDAPCCTAAFKI